MNDHKPSDSRQVMEIILSLHYDILPQGGKIFQRTHGALKAGRNLSGGRDIPLVSNKRDEAIIVSGSLLGSAAKPRHQIFSC